MPGSRKSCCPCRRHRKPPPRGILSIQRWSSPARGVDEREGQLSTTAAFPYQAIQHARNEEPYGTSAVYVPHWHRIRAVVVRPRSSSHTPRAAIMDDAILLGNGAPSMHRSAGNAAVTSRHKWRKFVALRDDRTLQRDHYNDGNTRGPQRALGSSSPAGHRKLLQYDLSGKKYNRRNSRDEYSEEDSEVDAPSLAIKRHGRRLRSHRRRHRTPKIREREPSYTSSTASLHSAEDAPSRRRDSYGRGRYSGSRVCGSTRRPLEGSCSHPPPSAAAPPSGLLGFVPCLPLNDHSLDLLANRRAQPAIALPPLPVAFPSPPIETSTKSDQLDCAKKETSKREPRGSQCKCHAATPDLSFPPQGLAYNTARTSLEVSARQSRGRVEDRGVNCPSLHSRDGGECGSSKKGAEKAVFQVGPVCGASTKSEEEGVSTQEPREKEEALGTDGDQRSRRSTAGLLSPGHPRRASSSGASLNIEVNGQLRSDRRSVSSLKQQQLREKESGADRNQRKSDVECADKKRDSSSMGEGGFRSGGHIAKQSTPRKSDGRPSTLQRMERDSRVSRELRNGVVVRLPASGGCNKTELDESSRPSVVSAAKAISVSSDSLSLAFFAEADCLVSPSSALSAYSMLSVSILRYYPLIEGAPAAAAAATPHSPFVAEKEAGATSFYAVLCRHGTMELRTHTVTAGGGGRKLQGSSLSSEAALRFGSTLYYDLTHKMIFFMLISCGHEFNRDDLRTASLDVTGFGRADLEEVFEPLLADAAGAAEPHVTDGARKLPDWGQRDLREGKEASAANGVVVSKRRVLLWNVQEQPVGELEITFTLIRRSNRNWRGSQCS